MSYQGKLLKNTAIIALGKISTQILSYILLPLYTAKMVTEEYGSYDFICTLSVFLCPIITLLIEECMFRFLIDADTDGKRKSIVTQTVIYSAKDSNDYLSKTIHEFAPLQSHRNRREFVVKWMKEFGIGQGFTIKSVGGEAHLVWITNNDGEKVNLADKGMGSIQLMVLLFRLAVMLPQNRRMLPMERVGKIIIIEEPEQNLHPMLQSKLADLFYSLNKDYGFRFIIETHSEYLIRKTQVLIASEHFASEEELGKKAPFKVIYFPGNEEPPYDMFYRTDGKFSNEFKTGFFDEASKLIFDIL